MTLDQALTELNRLVDDGTLKYSQFEEIKSQALHLRGAGLDNGMAHDVLANLVDDGIISHEAYSAIKEAISSDAPVQAQSAPQGGTNTTVVEDKPLKGALVGFLLGFFLSIIGMVIGILLGDDDCKKHSIIWCVVPGIVSIVICIITLIVLAISSATITATMIALF